MRPRRQVLQLCALAALLTLASSGRAFGQPGWIPPVVAQGDGFVVTGEELARRARLVAALLRIPPDRPDARVQVVRLAAGLVQHLVNLALVELYAAAEGTRADSAEVERRVALGEQRAGGPQALQAALLAWGLTADDLRRELAREVLWDTYLERFARLAVVREEFARRLYDDNRALYRVPDRYRLLGVVFGNRKPAEEFRRAVLRGVDFLGLARRVAANPFLQARGGEVGWLEDTRMQPWVLEMVRRLRPGELSPVFAGPGGWYVVRVVEVRPGRPLSYEEARPRILEDLRRTSARTDLYILVGRLRHELRVRVLWPDGQSPDGLPSSTRERPSLAPT